GEEHVALARAAVLFRQAHAEEAHRAHLPHQVPRELRRAVDLGGARRHPLARERAHGVENQALLIAEGIVRHYELLDEAGPATLGAPNHQPPPRLPLTMAAHPMHRDRSLNTSGQSSW